MRRCLSGVTAALLVPALACVSSESIGRYDTESQSAGEGGEDASTGSMDTDGSAGDGDGDTESGTDTDFLPPECAPEDGDTACTACTKTNCCDEWLACQADDHCVCIVVCHEEGHSLDACLQTCGDDGGEHLHLLDCQAQACDADC